MNARGRLATLFLIAVCAGCGSDADDVVGDDDQGPSSDARLVALAPSAGALSPAFDPATTSYAIALAGIDAMTLTPTAAAPGATITIGAADVASGTPSPALALALGPNPVSIVVTAEDGVTTMTYDVTIARDLAELYVKASNTERYDAFGRHVAIDGDTMVVTAANEDSDATGVDGDQASNVSENSGAAYVYRRNGATWVQEAYLKASNTGWGDAFGSSVALAGDVIAVGAMYEDGVGSGSGAVYVYRRTGTTWTHEAYVQASNAEASDYFGSEVALSDDTLVVGAYAEDSAARGVDGNQADNSAAGAGAAYVFQATGTTWNQVAYLKASNADAGDFFGAAVAIEGDTIVVAAPYEDGGGGIDGPDDNAAMDAGALYVFTRSGGSWTQSAYLKGMHPHPSLTAIGTTVAISGDTVAAGAEERVDIDGDWTLDGRAVFVFRRAGTTWSQEAILIQGLIDPHPEGTDFGRWAIALEGGTLLVGASREDAVRGAGYRYDRTGSTWSDPQRLVATPGDFYDAFAISVAISGGIIAIGASGEGSSATGINGDPSDNGAASSGAVYLWY